MEKAMTGKDGRHILFWVFVLATCVLGALIVAPFVPAISWAVVIAVLLAPWRDRLLSKGKSATMASLVPVLLAAWLVMTPILVAVGLAGAQAYSYVSAVVVSSRGSEGMPVMDKVVADLDQGMRPLLNTVGAGDFHIDQWYADNRSDLIERVRGPLVGGFGRFANGLLTLLIAVMTAFFALRDGSKLMGPTCDCVPLPQAKTKEILARMAQTIRSVFVGVVLVAVVQGLLAGIGYAVAGIQGWLVWTLVTVFMAMIPLLGPPTVYVPLGLVLLLQGKVGPGIGILAWGFIVVSNIDNVLRPFFIGQQTKLHPMAIFFSLLGGVLLLGPVGLMAGPVVLTLLIGLSEVVREGKSESIEPVDSPA